MALRPSRSDCTVTKWHIGLVDQTVQSPHLELGYFVPGEQCIYTVKPRLRKLITKEETSIW